MKVITIGSTPQCDMFFPKTQGCSDYIESLEPIECQIIQDNSGSYHLVSFSEHISINGTKVKGEVPLDIEDAIHITVIQLFWQQWFAGFGLDCKKCRYKKYSLQNDEWCDKCKQNLYAPSPYVWGYSQNYKDNKYEIFNYTDCNSCTLKPGWCCECTFGKEPMPKNKSYREHIEMYNERIREYESSKVTTTAFPQNE